MTRAEAKRRALGWSAEVIASAIAAGGLEGQRLTPEDERLMEAAAAEIIMSLQARSQGRGRGLAPWKGKGRP